jgi:bis(5'-nucleosyl)-tetraphosphatase (symmetrical)
MATYAIGDVQGCYDELRRLLGEIGFRRGRDKLWLVGDLVNRGPKSRDVLRYVASLGDAAVAVLGNHDLHLLAQYEGLEKLKEKDTFQDVLDAPDAPELIGWLRERPMMHVEGDYAMVHAGILPDWSVEKALELGGEVEAALAKRNYRDFLQRMYGNGPDGWRDDLSGWDRLRVIVNAMTRMRFCSPDGKMQLEAKGAKAPRGYRPWFETRPAGEQTAIVFGHWSQLGLKVQKRQVGLDSGCVWGGKLTAMRLEDRKLYSVGCKGYQAPGGE